MQVLMNSKAKLIFLNIFKSQIISVKSNSDYIKLKKFYDN